MMQPVLLAYSGGLDTSVILKWLINKGYAVTAFIADVGQDEDLPAARAKALQIGAQQVVVVDCKQELVTDYIYPALQAGAIYENRYLLGTALARPLIAKKLVEYAIAHNIQHIAHGATGKGNDQIRFELVLLQFMPQVTIIAPWKEAEFVAQFQGRSDLLNYAAANDIPVSSSLQKPYSIDENLMHTSYEAGILEDPELAPPADIFRHTANLATTPDTPTELVLHFAGGVPVKLEDITNQQVLHGDSVALFSYLNQQGSQHGIGRIDIVESRFVGMKSRGVYETPGGTILWQAHHDLECLTLDREVLLLKATLAPKIAQLIYNGFWFSPEMEMLFAAIQVSQKYVNGIVKLALFKGNVIIHGRASANSLYDSQIASMDSLDDYDYSDARGFIRLNALRLKKFKPAS
jgi:argininosuccinate synthase